MRKMKVCSDTDSKLVPENVDTEPSALDPMQQHLSSMEETWRCLNVDGAPDFAPTTIENRTYPGNLSDRVFSTPTPNSTLGRKTCVY